MNLILNNVRTFVGTHNIPLKPLTIITGENSTGKSTLLAMLNAVSQASDFPMRPGFNLAPFNLGGFGTICTRHTRARKNSTNGKCFQLGFSRDEGRSNESSLLGTYVSNQGQPELKRLEMKIELGKFFYEFEAESVHLRLEMNGGKILSKEFEKDPESKMSMRDIIFEFLWPSHKDNADIFEGKEKENIIEVMYSHERIRPDLLAIAPIRTEPHRTYDESVDSFNPEGVHIPYLLAKITCKKNRTKEENDLLESLAAFGAESGLFKYVDSKLLGADLGSPFQLVVNIEDTNVNLIDVGYGVSQALPVIVQTLFLSKKEMLLLQQPEVHLHPRAQAALGSFFAKTVAKSGKTFVIETHSDYLLDRIRLDVARKKVEREKVLILYLERKKYRTMIHQLTIDEDGNLVNAPPGYREFFLKEESAILGGGCG